MSIEELRSTALFENQQSEVFKQSLQRTVLKGFDLDRNSNGYVVAKSLPDWDEMASMFVNAKRFLSAQSYGKKLEGVLIRSITGMEEDHASTILGDAFWHHNAASYSAEFKCSLTFKGDFSIQQVRSKRDIDYYFLVLFDIGTSYTYLGMPPKSLVVSMLGARSHGKTLDREEGDDPEYGLRNVRVAVDRTLSPNLALLEPHNWFADLNVANGFRARVNSACECANSTKVARSG